MSVTRRAMLKGAAGGTLAAALPAKLRLAFGATGPAGGVLLFILLRGGMDGLNLVAPADDADLIAARPEGLRLTATGNTPALPLANGPTGQDWRLHPSAPELKSFYDAGFLAFIHAAGIPADSRSHFQMQAFLEGGVADPVTLSHVGGIGGWIARYGNSTGLGGVPFALVSADPTLPPSMNGAPEAVSIPSPEQFTLGSPARSQFLEAAYAGTSGIIGIRGRAAIDAATAYQTLSARVASPAAGLYPRDSFGTGLSVIARLIKAGAGLRLAEVEWNNWDTHVNQQPRFAASVATLSNGLAAFFTDLGALGGQVTVVAMSEFGRRVHANANRGTDHGHGGVMLVLGAGVRGKRIYGSWPGLAPSVLDLGDVPVTTDYRAVLSEVVGATGGNLPSGLFPGFAPAAPLGLFRSNA